MPPFNAAGTGTGDGLFFDSPLAPFSPGEGVEWMLFTLALLAAIGLDRIFADPDFSLHPVRLFGHWISFLEKILNRGRPGLRLFFGFFAVLLTIIPFYGLALGIEIQLQSQMWHNTGRFLYLVWNALGLFILIASEGLIREARSVIHALVTDESLEKGRMRLSRIVGRDTTSLDRQGILRAILETLSENLSDGVIAPLFYFSLGGVPALVLYKLINTLDSMIAYKNERFFYFGRFAARLDDVANFIPARLTGLGMLLVTGHLNQRKSVWRESALHESPNAGYPEAALAHILDCRLGGPAPYHGVLKEKSWLGKNPRQIDETDVNRAIGINRRILLLFVALILSGHLVVPFFTGTP